MSQSLRLNNQKKSFTGPLGRPYDIVCFPGVGFEHTTSYLHVHNKVISKVGRLGGENAEFQHNRASNA
jgi:hypothetical protein